MCGTHEGEVNYADWLAFFTTNPVCTTTDIGQFIRHMPPFFFWSITFAIDNPVVEYSRVFL